MDVAQTLDAKAQLPGDQRSYTLFIPYELPQKES